jgi:3-oxoadipate enol-lactonase
MLIKVNGIQMNHELSGQENGQVVMLSHSLGSSLVMWNPQIESLEPRFRVLRYDTRGHGGSEAAQGPYALEMLGQDAIGLMDALKLDKVHWVGLSMGGMIGQFIALNHPDRLWSLILCDTAALTPKESQPMIQERINTVREKGMTPLMEPTMERWFTPSFLCLNSQMLSLIRKQFLGTPVAGYIGCTEAIRKLNYLDRLSEIEIPTLIMVGEDDPGTPVSASKAMHERILESKLAILSSARHLSNVEQPQAFNETLVSFLRNLS